MSKTNGKGNGKAPDPSGTESDGVTRDARGLILPGSNLNPEGGRRGYAAQVRARLHTMLEDPDTDDDDKRTRLSVLLLSVYDRAVKGDMQAAKLILDRVMPATSHHIVEDIGMTPAGVGGVIAILRADLVKAGRLELPGG